MGPPALIGVQGEEMRDRNLHTKKHRRQLLSPPSATGNVPGPQQHTVTNGESREFMKMEDAKALTSKKAKRLLQNNNINK